MAEETGGMSLALGFGREREVISGDAKTAAAEVEKVEAECEG